jgi:hypothetical protein
MTDLPLTDRDRALLVGLADGTLRGRRRASVEARVESIPGGPELVRRQRRVAGALQGGPTPPVASPLSEVARAQRPMPAFRPRLAAVAAAIATALVVIAVLLPSGGATTAADIAPLGSLSATAPAPQPLPGVESRLAASFEGVTYPNWSHEFGWHATGARSDVVDGRATHTVYYQHTMHRIGYTVVSGKPLAVPDDVERINIGGVEIALLRDRDAAVFVRDGHTCVLSGHVMHRSTLIKLAAWKGGGRLSF